MTAQTITNILLIEDNAGDARLLREMFKEQGSDSTDVTHVVCMQDAERHLADHTVDIILLDLGLPDANGLEAVRRAHAAAPGTPLVILTVIDDESLAIQALQEGAQDYLIKGEIESGLLRALRYAIERKIMEETLTRERIRSDEGWARLAAIHEATPDLVSISDPDGRLIYMNRGGRAMIGLGENADISGHTIADFLPENAAAHVVTVEGIPNAVRDGIWRGETELVSLDARTISVSLIILAHKASDGSVEFVSAIARDITASKRIAVELRASEGRLRRLLDSNIIGVAFWNGTGDVLNANDLFLKMTGYSRDDLQHGKLRWTDFSAPEYASSVAKSFKEMAATGTCTPFENELVRKDGTRITVMVGSALLEGQTDSGTSFVMDITERKQAEAQSRLQSAALNAAANAIVITARDLKIVWNNPAFTKLTGYTDHEALGSDVLQLLSAGVSIEDSDNEMKNTLFAGESWRGETTNRRKDGSLYSEAQTITPVKDDDGAITHFISIKTDLTAQRQMEAQLRQGQKMEAVGQLAAGVAHEFNNLLQALMSMATIIRVRSDTPEIAKIGQDMEFQIKRGGTLTQQLLLFSRDVPVEKQNLDLQEQVQKARVLLRQLIPENIRIVVEAPPERLTVQADAGQLQQLLLNLAINARDAMPAGGILTLRSGLCDGEVFLDVEDTGLGMNAVTRTHLFEPFFTTKDPGKGTGLGLAVVHGIVVEHGGRIEVESRTGEGSRFRVILPATPAESITFVEPRQEQGVSMGSGRVLLVEDEQTVRDGVALLLETIGYDVTAIGSGEEAIAMPLLPAPDLLLTDVTLAGIGGPALGDALRDRWPSIKVVLMSGYFDESSQANASERAWHFLQKPFEMSELAGVLRAALDGNAGATTRSAHAPDLFRGSLARRTA